MPGLMPPRPERDGTVPPEVALQIHELEWSVRELTFENHELRMRLRVAEETLHQRYGSRAWRALESARRLGLGRGRK